MAGLSPAHRNPSFCVAKPATCAADPQACVIIKLTKMVLHNPNNWHWVNKDASEWAREYLDEKLVGIEASEGESEVKVTKIDSMDGDVDVSQRKGKVITLFDVKLQLEYEGECNHSTVPILLPHYLPETPENFGTNSILLQARLPKKSQLLALSPYQKSLTTPRKMSTSYVLPLKPLSRSLVTP